MTQRFYRLATLPAAVGLLALALPGQQAGPSSEVRVSSQAYAPQPFTFRTGTRLVEVGVTVRDSHGRAVPGLTEANFRIFDDGVKVNVAAFAQVLAAPDAGAGAVPAATSEAVAPPKSQDAARPTRFLAVFFDDLSAAYGEEAGAVARTQAAASKYVKSSLSAGVQMGIFTASGTPALDFTADPEKILAAIAEVKAHPQYAEKVCAGMNPYQAYRIAKLNDRETIRLVAIADSLHKCPNTSNGIMVQAAETWDRVKATTTRTLGSVARVVDSLAARQGQRVLLLASSGFVGETMELEQDRIIDRAVHAGVVVNSLVTKGLFNDQLAGQRFDDPLPGKALYMGLPGYQAWAKAENAEVDERPMVMDEAMGALARGTGGILFHNNNDLNTGFRETSAGPEVTYRMSFKPAGAGADGAYHQLRVELVDAKSYSAEARPGYFAQAERVENERSNLDQQVLGAGSSGEVAANIALGVEKRSEAQRAIHVKAHVDIAGLPFLSKDDRQNEVLIVVAALFDAQGKMVAAKEGRMELALKPETKKRMLETGINAELTLLAAPGIYKLRAVVEEVNKGSMAASTYPIDVR